MQVLNFRIHKLYSRPIGFRDPHHVHRFGFLENLLYVVSGMIILLWAMGFLGMNINSGIHILLIIAANLFLLGIIQHQKIKKIH